MLIDLSLKDSRVLIIGSGKVGMRKARGIIGECKKLTIASERFPKGVKTLERAGATLVKTGALKDRTLGALISDCDVVIAATSDHDLNRRVAEWARASGVLLGSVDDPAVSDFNFPAVRAVGDIRIGVSTGGRSPAMARLICMKLADAITPEDRLWVKLMSRVRSSAMAQLSTPGERRASIYKVLKDENVRSLVRAGRLGEASDAARAIIAGK
ncbi:MAG: bifunctional precorrin-2 dehydrogenase/sirohydrochlorin ferrochelatase [Nitrososphaerota archaeon]|nr:bifunctional precorrin-2 dehydrogenase/sirohydrochlorin ferrochelatase [Nitrososphaerota archaeon]MDG7023675.1 bifunctional precorrin-2 dehydrogenase/sirohydrochlorin ferrochelatase [Nitrososphaerota archaeon]